MDKLVKWLENLLRAQKKSRAWRTFVSCLAAIVVFTTTYSLILPAITVEQSATEEVGGLVLDEADPGSTGAEAEAPGEVVTVDADNETSDEVPDEAVQEEAPAADEEAADTAPTEETASENKTTQSAASQTETTQTSESKAAVAEEVREPVNGEVQTVGDKRVMTLTGEDFDVIVSGDLSVGVSDRTVLSVRGIPDAEVVKSFSDRISDELLKIFVDKKTTEILYQLVFTDENLVEYTPAGYFDVQFIFHNNTVSHTGEKIYAAIYDYLTDEMVLAEKNGDAYETPVIALDEYGIIKGITLKGMHFDEYSDIITLVAGPVNEELKLAAEKAANGTATESKTGNSTKSTEGKTEKAESGNAKTDSAESKSEGPSAKAETTKDKEETGSGVLTARGSDYTVTLTYGADAKIPGGSAVEVTEIENGTKAYKKYLKQAKAAMGLDENQELPREQARFFDIKIMSDGKEVQPAANVSVNITYDQPVVEADPNTEAQIDASAVHFGKKGAEVVEVSEADATCVEFEAESFSVYGVIYTVDFEYTDPITGQVYYYSLEGGKSINLTELLVLLGIKTEENVEEFVANQVENVEFSDSELVKVSHKGKILGIFGTEDWKLESLKPFTTEETLTISLNNGDEIVVKVTDALSYETDIKPMLTSATIEGADKNEQGAYVIKSGVPYNVHFTFEEVPNGMQFKTDGPITYQLPAGFSALLSGGTATITGNHGERIEADYVINNGLITLTWKNTDSADFQTFANSEYGVINLDIEGVFDDNVTEIKFSDTVTADVVIDHTRDVSVSKKGTFNPETKQIDYTVYVTSTGNNREIKVQDTISGTALTYAGNTFNVESNKRPNVPSRPDPSYQGTNGFGIIIPDMQSGEIITITYSADVDFTGLTKNDDGSYGTVEETGNGVKVKSEHTPEHEDKKSGKDLENKIEISTLDKSAGEITDAENGKKTITWTIRINEQQNISLAGKTLTDIIAENSRQYMSYSGTGIHISRSDGQTYDVDWGASGDHGNLTNAYGGSTWTYTFPENEGIFAYTITYTTEVDADKIVVATTLNNTSNFEYDNDSAGKKVEPDGTEVTGEKRAVNTNLETKETTWQIDFTVPEKGLASAVVTDTYPYFSGDDRIRDTLKEGSIKVYEEVNGAWVEFDTSQGERYDPVTSDPTKAVITFYKTVDGVETTGLIGKGSVRNIRVELTTVASQEFLEQGEQYDYAKTHTNNANIKVNGQDIDKSAQVVLDFTEKSIEKSNFTVDATSQVVWVDGKKIPAFGYRIELTGVNDSVFDEYGDLIIEDEFDSNYLTYMDLYQPANWWNNQNAKVFKDQLGNNTWNQIKDGDAANTINYLTFDGVNKLTFTLNKSDLIENGLYAKKYRIQYFLVPKDLETFENMQSTALNSEGLKVSFDNSVSAEKFGDDTVTTDYEVDELQKNVIREGLNQDTGNYEVKFELKVNKDKLKIGDEDTVTLEDTFTNLSMDYTTIKVYEMNEWGGKGDEADDVVINRSGFTTIFTLKNEQSYVIEYTGRVIGSGPVHWNNLADLEGLKRTKEGNATISSSGSGSFANYNMKVLKYEEGDMTKGLAATFALYEKEGDGEWELSEQYGSFTTDENGQFSLDNLHKYEDRPGRRFQYYILETVAPEGFKKDDTHYEFRIGDTADYPNRIYLNDDVVTIVNKPKTEDTTEATVNKEWISAADESNRTWPEGLKATFVLKDNNESQVEKPESAGDTWKNPVTLDSENQTYTWTDLPILESGSYVIEETGVVNENDEDVTNRYSSESTTEDTVTTITNTEIKTVSVEVEKKFEDQTTANQPTAVQFELYESDGITPVIKDAAGEYIENPIAVVKSDDGNGTWTNKAVWEGLTPLEYGNYVVKETGVYFGELTTDDDSTEEDESGKVPAAARWAQPTLSYEVTSDPSDGKVEVDEDGKGSITFTNKPILQDVHIEKTWDSNVTEDMAWEAKFVLEELEYPYADVNGNITYNAEEAHDSADHMEDSWSAVTPAVEWIINNTSTPADDLTLKDLPKFRTKADGKVYILMYSVTETEYTVWDSVSKDNVLYHWKHGEAATGDIHFTPEYLEDADDITDYTIEVLNSEKKEQEDIFIDLDLTKRWEPDESVAEANDSYAIFQLKRTSHQEFKALNDPEVDYDEFVTVTLTDAAGNVLQQLEVEKNAQIKLQAGFKAGREGSGTVTFQNSADPSDVVTITSNAGTNQQLVSSTAFRVDEDVTYKYVSGADYLADGLHGVVISDRCDGQPTADVDDVQFNNNNYCYRVNKNTGHVVTYSDGTLTDSTNSEGWTIHIEDLPQLKVDTGIGTETTTVYGYYFEEVESYPEYHATFYEADSDGNPTEIINGDKDNRMYFNDSVVAVNKEQHLTIKKYWESLVQDQMPNLVVDIKKVTVDSGFNVNNVDGSPTYKRVILTAANNFEYDLYNLETNAGNNQYYAYVPVEVGITTKTDADTLTDADIIPISNEAFERATYAAAVAGQTINYMRIKADGTSVSNFTNLTNKADIIRSGAGTICIVNWPKKTGYQLAIRKRWHKFTADGGLTTESDYSGAYFTAMLVQIVKDAQTKQEIKRIDYGDTFEWKYNGNTSFTYKDNGKETNITVRYYNGQWLVVIPEGQGNDGSNLPVYGYYIDDNGNEKIAEYDYTVREISITSTDGYHWALSDHIQEGSAQDLEGTGVSGSGHIWMLDNYPDADLKIIKHWPATPEKAGVSKVYFKITNTNGENIIEDIVSKGTFEEHQLSSADVAQYNGEWCLVIEGATNSRDDWVGYIDHLPLFDFTDTVFGNGTIPPGGMPGEINYNVEEVAAVQNGELTDSSNVFIPYYQVTTRGTKGSIRSNAEGIQLGMYETDDEGHEVLQPTIVEVTNNAKINYEIEKKFYTEDGEQVDPAAVDEWKVGDQVIDKIQYVLQVKATKTDSDGNVTVVNGYVPSGFKDAEGGAERTIAENISGAQVFELTSNDVTTDGKTWKAVPPDLQGLPSVDARTDGSKTYIIEYEYKVVEKAVYAGGTDVTKFFQKVIEVDDENEKWTISNTRTQLKSFSFDKEWYGIDTSVMIDWPTDNNGNQIPIKVTLTRKLKVDGQEALIEETGDDKFTRTDTLSPSSHGDWTVEVTNKVYKFTLDGLDSVGTIDGTDGEWQYFITEVDHDAYNTEYYLKDGTKQGPDKKYTDDGGKIKNIEAQYTLPSTGGFGTAPFHTIGLMLFALAAGLYTFLNRKKLTAIRSSNHIVGFGRDENRRGGGDGL